MIRDIDYSCGEKVLLSSRHDSLIEMVKNAVRVRYFSSLDLKSFLKFSENVWLEIQDTFYFMKVYILGRNTNYISNILIKFISRSLKWSGILKCARKCSN